ncbi:D-alanyl-D-alanine carboxypeptidase/D-alanyl-D-alanine-endopeptidase [Agromyces sp. SYSU T00194]|uniref:D-alanyl-D-alanine carboxypeptidase/D-alanyl-D-alanine-endopeptidase n=1 Tax=Agromyces chitinivorans TaxID=3158560 RepID=UPI0033993124
MHHDPDDPDAAGADEPTARAGDVGDDQVTDASGTSADSGPANTGEAATADVADERPETDAAPPARPSRRRLALWATAGVVAFALAGWGAVAAGSALAGARAEAALPTPTETPTPTPTPEPSRPAPTSAPEAAPIRTCMVGAAAADERLGAMQAQVRNASTGEVLYDRGGETASRTASVMKVLTAAAALDVLGPDYRATTTVVRGSEPGSVVLVGGGDLTLSRTPTGSQTVYPGAAHLDDLAAQVRAAWDADPSNPPLTKLVLDASFFGGEEWHPTWNPLEREQGFMSQITALQVDGDRDDAFAETSWRSPDPVGRAGDAFAAALGGIGAIERGTAPADAAELGSVSSPTVAELVQKSLIVSDNTVAEMLARHVAIRTGAGNDFAAIDEGVRTGLEAYGIDTEGITVVDGSGLSDDNRVPPSYLTELFRIVEDREQGLGVIRDGLPVAGVQGSLSYADRFFGDNAVARGAVWAKTGWIETGYTLSGIIHAADGTQLTFAIYALGDAPGALPDSSKQAIDTLTTAFYRCGDNLSNG